MAEITRLFDLADPRVKKIWDQKNTQLSSRLEYHNLGLTDYKAEILDTKFENFTGLGLAQATGEKEAYARQDIDQADSVTITPVKFTTAIDITEEMLRFNMWPQINNLTEGVAFSLNARIDTDAAKIFYLGFGTTFFTGGDGSALFATHTLKDGSTYSNNLGTIPLSYDNLKTAWQTLDQMTDDKGIPILPTSNLRLIVGRGNKERAMEVLRSVGNPDSANRINNVFNGAGSIDLVVSNWIPNTTYGKYWFLIDTERASKMAYMVWGWKPKFDDDKVVNNGTKVYTGSVMFKPGFQAWQWAVGSAATT